MAKRSSLKAVRRWLRRGRSTSDARDLADPRMGMDELRKEFGRSE